MPLDATSKPGTFDAKERTIEVIWSTGAAVQRRDARGVFNEVLSLDKAHVDLSRMIGASVLDGHRQGGVRDVLGVVTDARLESGVGVATIKLSARADVAPIVQDIGDGILRNVSIGYSVAQWAESIDSSGQRSRTAVKWTPHEISFVTIAADPGATTRSQQMPDNITPSDNQTLTRAQVNAQIRSVAELAGLDDTWANGQIDREASIEDARAAAFDAMRTRTTPAIRTQQVGLSNDDPAVIHTRMAGALAGRMGATMDDASRPYAHMGLVDMARVMLMQRGVAGVAMLSREEILTRAQHTVSDFPNLLTGAGNRILTAAYQLAASPIKGLARQTTMVDFRPKTVLRTGDFDQLAKITESGEIKATSTSEAKESYSLDTFARIFRLSRKAMINDDLGAFAQWNQMMGRAAAETETSLLIDLLLANGGNGPTMDDGNTLFHASHGNLAAAGAYPDVGPLSDGRLAMRHQKGLEGKMPINVAPRTFLVPAELETRAEQLVTQIQAMAPSDVNPFSGKLSVAVESRLPAWAWYLWADPAVAPVLEYAYLSSAQGPQLASRDGFDVLGREFRCLLDFGAGVVDHRGAYRNPGAAAPAEG
jgi:hypothetical protein